MASTTTSSSSSRPRRWSLLRCAAMVPPTALAAIIIAGWSGFTWLLAAPLLATCTVQGQIHLGPRVYAASTTARGVLLVALLALHLLLVPLLLSFYRAVFTQPGAVPEAYKRNHR